MAATTMTVPLTPEQLAKLREMEKALLGERTRPAAVAIAAEDNDPCPPWLRGRGPRGLHGWLRGSPAPSKTSVAEAAVVTGEPPVVQVEPVRPTHRLRLGDGDADAPMLIRSARRAYPEWSIAQIAESLGVSVCRVQLALADSARGAVGYGLAYGAVTRLDGTAAVRSCGCGRHRI